MPTEKEFPTNQANWFKIRLPQPLRLTGSQWQVGLSAISLPDTGVNIFNLLQADQFVFGTSSYRLTSEGRTVRRYKMKMDDLKHDNSIGKDEAPCTLNRCTFNAYRFVTRWWKSFKRKRPKPMETWSRLAKATPWSRCTSKRHKKT